LNHALSKIKRQCHADLKDVFGSKIVQILSEKVYSNLTQFLSREVFRVGKGGY
jgi:hypothetical protein